MIFFSNKFWLIGFCVLFLTEAKAQDSFVKSYSIKPHFNYSFDTNKYHLKSTQLFLLGIEWNKTLASVAVKYSKPVRIQSSVHYSAFFCKLECSIHKQTNVWVKFRAGNDDVYRKLMTE